MISFGNPWFLLALPAIGIPIYLHLYYKRNPTPRDFPSLRLIKLSMQAMVRRMQLKNIVLLILRILVILFLATALAKPSWKVGNTSPTQAGAPAAFVIILDNSLSMGASHQGISLFHSGKAKALEILDQMGAYDKASIVLLNDPGTLLFPQLTWDKQELKEALRNAPLSMAGTNMVSALHMATRLLQDVRSFKRSVYLISDMTADSWQPLLTSSLFKDFPKDIERVLIPLGTVQPQNLTLSDLALASPIVLRGKPTPIWATVTNHSPRPGKSTLSFFVNGDKKSESPLEIKANESKRVLFSSVFPQEGTAHVKAMLGGDSLPQDDSRHLAVKVLQPQRVLIIKPPPDRQGRETREELFLKFALNPMLRKDGATFQVETFSADELRQVDPSVYSLIFLVNQRNLPEEFTPRLTSAILGGGNLVVFMGSRVDPTWYNLHLMDKPGNDYLLPCRLLKRVGNAVSKVVSYRLTDTDFQHSAFRLFSQEGNGDPGRAEIFEYYQVEPNRSALVLAKMSHGLPAILEEKRGQGRVMLLTFTADTSWTSWPLKPTFLPFIQQVALGMISKQGMMQETVLPGMPVSFSIKEQGLKKIQLTFPSGKISDISFKNEGGGFAHFSTTETDEAGYYQLLIHKEGQPRKEAFAVNFPAAEGNLERLDAGKAKGFITIQQKPGARESLGEKIAVVREGRDFSTGLLWALLLLALAETVLANIPFHRTTNP
jgi:hypothetical protein